MDCCYLAECDTEVVTPALIPQKGTLRYCEEAPEYSPKLPACRKPVMYCYKEKPDTILYCNEKKPQKVMYCSENKPKKIIYCYDEMPQKMFCCANELSHVKDNPKTPKHEPKSAHPKTPCCKDHESKPITTKYIMPCYRYEDGRIERYVPTRYGRLPLTAYRNNGIQDQMHGYRGAVRYLCAGNHPFYGNCVHTVVEPMRTWYPKITQEVLPIRKKKDKKCA